MKTLIQYNEVINSNKRFRIFQGGTRSGKTYNICIALIDLALTNKNIVISVFRKNSTTIKHTTQIDIFNIIDKLSIPYHFRVMDKQITFDNGSQILLKGVDEPHKVKGFKQDISFFNEVTEFNYEDFFQVSVRTKLFSIVDFNPSKMEHFIYDLIEDNEKSDFFKSTYKDNEFLTADQIKEIERSKDRDEFRWQVYGLGEKALLTELLVYPHFKIINELPTHLTYSNDNWFIGMDFGYTNSKTAVVLVRIDNDNKEEIYVEELLYKNQMTTEDIYNFFVNNNLTQYRIYADSSEAMMIDILRQKGLRISGANKDKQWGISRVKDFNTHILKTSKNFITEMQSYRFLENKQGDILNEPIKKNDHLLDAYRYAIATKFKKTHDNFIFM